MPYTLTLEERPGYVHARVTGSNTRDSVIEYTLELQSVCAHRGWRRVLLEEDLAGPSLDVATMYEIVTERSRQAVASFDRIAYVDTNPQHQAARLEFLEDVAVNRGVNVRVFPTVAEARKWIEAEIRTAEAQP